MCDIAVRTSHSATFTSSFPQSLLGVMYKIIEKDPPSLPDRYHGDLRALFGMWVYYWIMYTSYASCYTRVSLPSEHVWNVCTV